MKAEWSCPEWTRRVQVPPTVTPCLQIHTPRRTPLKLDSNATLIPSAAFQPPESDPYRAPDSADTFATYKYRQLCNISSLDLHSGFSPLCTERTSMLAAMSSGGRIGHDAPYMPRGCDMRWFTTKEVCEILGRFEKVVFAGDSMMRHVIGSLNVLLRKDLGFGAVTDWNFSDEERYAGPSSSLQLFFWLPAKDGIS